jgi:hypothetical protein
VAVFRTLEQKHHAALGDAPNQRPVRRSRHRSVDSRPVVPKWRWVAATLVVLLAAICVSAWIDNHVVLIDHFVGGSDYWGFSLVQAGMLWLAGFVAGCVVRRWSAVLFALLPIVVAIPFGATDFDGFHFSSDPVAYYLAALAPFCAAFIAAGVLAASLVQYRRHQGAAPAVS